VQHLHEFNKSVPSLINSAVNMTMCESAAVCYAVVLLLPSAVLAINRYFLPMGHSAANLLHAAPTVE